MYIGNMTKNSNTNPIDVHISCSNIILLVKESIKVILVYRQFYLIEYYLTKSLYL